MLFKAFLLLALLAVVKIGATPLDDYVNAPDAYFSYKLLKTYEKVGFKLYVLNVTSQKWMNESWVQNPVWWHFVSITVPDKLTRPDAAMLVIDGGGMGDDIPDETDSVVELTTILAVSTGAVVVDLKQTPNQPLVFLNDPTRSRRSEDNAISWTWKTFLENPDDPDNQKFILYLPMVKSVVKTMDAASDFLQKTEKLNINKYMVAGPSKRGWATWLTMAVDKRVFAAVPIVMDLLNLNTNLHNHFRSLGGWTFAFDRYHQNNVTKYIDSYSMFAMEKIIDPLNYLDRYRDIKTLAIVTGGDEFFLIDETQSYWDNVVSATGGSILLRRIPNAEHTCVGHEISLVLSIRSFFMTVYDGLKLPRISWLRANNRTHGILQATVDLAQGPRPYDVKVYYARTLDGKRKDFRLVVADPNDPDKKMAHPVIWESTTHVLNTKETPDAITYTAAFPKPIVGWLGFFIQFNFQSVDSSVIVATTETNVIPETYPFADCTLDSCLGTLV